MFKGGQQNSVTNGIRSTLLLSHYRHVKRSGKVWAITGENQLTQTDWKSAEAMELSDKVIKQLFQYVYIFFKS